VRDWTEGSPGQQKAEQEKEAFLQGILTMHVEKVKALAQGLEEEAAKAVDKILD
jgi:hypothetical protein